jgi:hypothetical protein
MQSSACKRKYGITIYGGCHPMRVAGQKEPADLLFQARDMLTRCGLAQAELPGRDRKTLRLGDRDKAPK